MGKTLLIIGDDKIGRKLIHRIESVCCAATIYLDRSSTVKRIFKLLLKKRILARHFMEMAIASFMRRTPAIGEYPSIASNRDLLDVISKESPGIIYFFRAGLVINKTVIGTGVNLINIHCAKVPEYGGLASVARALVDQSYSQYATMHRVAEEIDSGEILKVEPYEMKRNRSYRENEDIAYDAGIRLILRELGGHR